MTPEDHSGGPVRCEQLGSFVDGELAPEEAAAFRRHLLVCARCQQEMHGLMQLSALAEVARERRTAPVPELRRRRSPPWPGAPIPVARHGWEWWARWPSPRRWCWRSG